MSDSQSEYSDEITYPYEGSLAQLRELHSKNLETSSSNPVSEDTVHSTTQNIGDAIEDSIEVVTCSKVEGRRKWDKVFYCYYCQKAQKKISRHLKTMHKDEPEVIKMLIAEEEEEKEVLLCKLRNLGNHVHNCTVLREGKGKLLVGYRPSVKSAPQDYVPCEHCLGYFSKGTLWKHQCPVKRTKTPQESKVRQGRLLLPAPPGVKDFLKPIITNMHQDVVYHVVRNDPLILQLAERLFLKLGHDKEQNNYIRGKMREMGRLLIEIRKLTSSPDAGLESFIDPAKFSILVEAARNVARFDGDTCLYGTPSVALKIGHSLKKCVKIVKGKALETSNKALLDRAENLGKLCELDWTDKVSSNENAARSKMEQP